MKIRLKTDPKLCSACGACAIACMDQNDIDPLNDFMEPFRKVYQYESPECKLISYSISCMHCKNAPCVLACPAGVLYKDEETGLTLYDNTNCIGCHSCSMACPYGAPSFGPNGKMVKCNGCIDRVRAGLDPACAHTCPTGALTWKVEDNDGSDPLQDYKFDAVQ